MPQRGAAADDLVEAQLAPNLVFEVELLLGELVLQPGDLAVGESVVERRRDLPCDLSDEVDLVLVERRPGTPHHREHAEGMTPGGEREGEPGGDPLRPEDLHSPAGGNAHVDGPGFAGREELREPPALHRKDGPFLDEAAAVGEVEGVEARPGPVRVDEDDAGEVAAQDGPGVRRDRPEEVLEVEIREDALPDLEDELQLLAAPREPLVRRSEALEARRTVDRERDLVGDDGEKGRFLPRIGIGLSTRKRHRPHRAARRRKRKGVEGPDAVTRERLFECGEVALPLRGGPGDRPQVRGDPRLDRLLERNGLGEMHGRALVDTPDVPARPSLEDVAEVEAQEIESDEAPELPRERGDELFGIADRPQDLRDPEKGPVALDEGGRSRPARVASHPPVTSTARAWPPDPSACSRQNRKVSPV